jgi:2-polyprenyl-3-methyl-5-hydroxy-6-metoxy-1,4-benzoquinol methylase
MANAGYVEYDPLSRRFTLPPEHIPALAQERGPVFFGGVQQQILGMIKPLDQIINAFRHGGGVPQSAYDEDMWEGLERFSAGWFDNYLIQSWIPAMPEVQAKLQEGVLVADVGCGRGRALIKLAEAFPRSRFVGYDAFAPTIARAAENAAAAGVSDRVRFQHLDVSTGLPEQYDIITTFDVVHDAINPRGLVRSIREGLKPGGRYVCLDINCSDKLEDNAGPMGAMFHSVSILYCMTTSLAHEGEGLGTVGLPESKLRELCDEAGFGDVRRVPLEDPFNNLYEVTLPHGL